MILSLKEILNNAVVLHFWKNFQWFSPTLAIFDFPYRMKKIEMYEIIDLGKTLPIYYLGRA